MRNISEKNCKENQNTHFGFSNVLLVRKFGKYCRSG